MTRPRKPKPSTNPDDARLFREAVADATPLSRQPRVEHDLPRPLPVPEQRLRDNREALADSLSDLAPWDAGVEAGEELSYVRNGIGSQTLRKLRRGHWVIQDELDLHSLTSDEARALLVEFLNRCLRRGLRCVRIIHGKGLRSPNREPVLKRKLTGWLMQRQEVLAYCQAKPADGGGGAVIVLLRTDA